MKFENEIQNSLDYLSSEAALAQLRDEPYWPKWNTPWWHITLLWEMGLLSLVPKKMLDEFVDVIDSHYIHFFPKTLDEIPPGTDPYRQIPCHCALGTVYQIFFHAGIDVDQKLPWLREWFLKYQLDDGGLNCTEGVYTKPNGSSSIISSLPVFEAVLLKRNGQYTPSEKLFLNRAYQYLVDRKLFRSLSKGGAVMNPDFLKLIFPRFYEYDVLRGLRFISNYCKIFDQPFPREALQEAIEHIHGHEQIQSHEHKGQIQIGRRFWDREGNYIQFPIGKWSRGKSVGGFDLLEVVSRTGEPSTYLTNEWLTITGLIDQQPSVKCLILEPAGKKDIPQIQKIFNQAPQYSLNTEGVLANTNAGEETLSSLPPNTLPSQKHVFLVKDGNTVIGVADIVDGYPDAKTAFLGLLLLSQDLHSKGLGTRAYLAVENFVKKNTECETIRLSVIESNPVIPFWEKMGFQLTGESKPHQGAQLTSRKLLMQKDLNR